MVKIDIGNLGWVDVGKKLKSQLKINSTELLEKYSDLKANLSPEAIRIIKEAVDQKKEVKTKKNETEITKFFEKYKSFSGTMGVGEDEIGEMEKIDGFKSQQMDADDMGQGQVNLTDSRPETNGYETYDRDSGLEEGQITLGRAGKEGKLVPVKINEKLSMFLEHDGTPSEQKNITTGLFSIENNSSKDRLWDIDLKLKNINGTDLEEEKISIKELPPKKSEEINYSLNIDGKQDLEITEYISTLNDPETESYSLALNAQNEIYCAIQIKNISEDNLTNIKINKIIPELFEDVNINNSSLGAAEIGEYEGNRAVEWTIEQIEPNDEAKIELRLDVNIQDKDSKIRSGKIIVMYTSPKSLSGTEIDKFDAYTNNSFYIALNELDETPDEYNCQFVFENKSEFMLRLVNADVYDPNNPNEKFVDIDPGEIPPLPEGAKWESKSWNFKAEEGIDPNFRTKVEFFAIADHQIETHGLIDINDVELAVASIGGELSYDVSQIPSFRSTVFNVNMKVENTGGADLNEVILTEKIQTGFNPPSSDEISVLLNGNEIEISSDSINIENNDGSTVSIELKNLRDTSIKFQPGDMIEVTYPITADKPSKSTIYRSDVIYTANTFPAGQPLEVIPDVIEIEVVHVRKRLIKGKEITALVDEGQYEITLYVVNTGKFDIEKFEIQDKIPDNFEYSSMTLDPEITSMEGADLLKWVIDIIKPGDRVEIRYRLSGEGKPSDAQETV